MPEGLLLQASSVMSTQLHLQRNSLLVVASNTHTRFRATNIEGTRRHIGITPTIYLSPRVHIESDLSTCSTDDRTRSGMDASAAIYAAHHHIYKSSVKSIPPRSHIANAYVRDT